MRRFSTVLRDIPAGSVFVAVCLSWVVTSVAGSLPYLLTGMLGSFEQALFESVSGFTCTGSSVLSAADYLDATPGPCSGGS
ncbi:MAG: hypothetical protein R2716_04590 [Microthrixaceae bacterium]